MDTRSSHHLSVTDVDKAAAFYTQQAGFTLDVDYHPAATSALSS